MTSFSNEPVGNDALPRLVDDDFVAVDPNWLRVSLLGMGTFALAVAAGGITIAMVVSSRVSGTVWWPLVVAACIVLLTGVAAALRVIEIRHIAYLVREHDISYRSGVLVRRVSTVPFVRVQHARIRQGPIQRRFALASLEVNSAGPDLKIDGLPSGIAEQLKALVVERAGDLVENQ